jgi:NAD(P)H-flavin reductase
VGRVTDHFDKVDIDPANAFGAIVGPPPMYRSVADMMQGMGLHYDRIYVSFERNMRCGQGKCGHCMIGHQYVCIDGPVFNYWEAVNIQGAM